jgi:hypothetical protein
MRTLHTSFIAFDEPDANALLPDLTNLRKKSDFLSGILSVVRHTQNSYK